jgi:WD40 repeat protein
MKARWDILAIGALVVMAMAALAAATRADDQPLPEGAVARLGSHAFRHDHTVSALAFSADGKRLASASWDKTARVWDVETGRELCRFAGHKEGASAVALSPDGALAASGDMKRATVLWDAKTGREIHRTADNQNTVFWLRFTADGKRLVWCAGKSVRVWNVAQWREERQIAAGEQVRPVVLSPDGATLAVGCEHGSIKIYRLDDGSLVKSIDGPDKMVFGLACSPDGKRLLAGTANGDVRVHDAATGELIHSVAVPDHWVRPVAWIDGGNRFAAAGQDGTLWTFDAQSGRETGRIPVATRGDFWVMAMAVSPDGKTLATCGTEKAIRLWDAGTLAPLGPPAALAGHTHEIGSIAFVDGGEAVATASEDGLVNVWEAASGRKLGQLGDRRLVGASLAASADGSIVAVASEKPSLDVFDARARKLIGVFADRLVAMHAVAVSPDGSLVAVAQRHDTVRVLETRSGIERCVVKFNPRQYADVPLAFSPDGRSLAIGSGDPDKKFVGLVDTTSGALLAELPGRAEGYHALAFAPDGLTLAVSRRGAPIQLVEVTTGKVRGAIEGDTDAGTCAAYSPDGRLIAAGGGPDKPTVRVWSVATGKLLAKFVGHNGWLKQVAFSPDSSRLASASEDTTAVVWDVASLARRLDQQDADAPTLAHWWEQLAGDDAAAAYAAVQGLAASRNAAEFLVARLAAPETNGASESVAKLIAALDADTYADRQAAQRALADMGESARPALRAALEKGAQLPEETRTRLSVLLKQLDRPPTAAASPERLRTLRAVEALERASATDALKRIAASNAPAAERAKAAVGRLTSHPSQAR